MTTRFLSLVMILCVVIPAHADYSSQTIDFLEVPDVDINAAGPLLVQMDVERNRLIVANTLSSSLTLIDCSTHAITNIPMRGRALQHLKSESMAINQRTGDVCLIGANCLFAVDVTTKTANTIATDVQFESVAIDDNTGHAFAAGRESKSLGTYKPGDKKIKSIEWLETSKALINLNQTPPPPIRRVIVDSRLGQLIAIDGDTSTLYVFDTDKTKLLRSRSLDLKSGGRWHLAGYDQPSHALFLVTETDTRNVIQAARIDIVGGSDVVVPLPELREGVGITYNPKRNEVYVAYDNHATVHVITFDNGGEVDEIKIPAYGNDAAVVDTKNEVLYVASWAHGEVDVIDLAGRRLEKRIAGLGIIPHMFAMAFNPNNNLIYYPKGASAVNGTFGSAISELDPAAETVSKIHTGWAPIDMIELPERDRFLVFNSEDQFAEVLYDGSYQTHTLPYDYPIETTHNHEGDVYLAYGPHQSYWPTVYIWGAKNGVLTIDAQSFEFYDRRVPRQAHEIALDGSGVLYGTQNNWGKEEQFIATLEDPVRLYEANNRLRLEDEVEREITQRILEYDPETNRLYLVRIGEKDEDPSILQVIDPSEKKVLARVTLGLTASDLVFDHKNIYVANFDSKSVSVIDKTDYTVTEFEAGDAPLSLCLTGGRVFSIGHLDNRLREIGGKGKTYKIPFKGFPNNVFPWGETLVVTSHNTGEMGVLQFDPVRESFSTLLKTKYPYGDTRFDTRNVSFYVRGQYGDAVFEITQGRAARDGRLWVTDFLAGKAYIIEESDTPR
ncbi:MAG: hypothetical protein JSW50_03040 [Candidatus Latescibacterota bacterium]|nr:MAG: hypothetical protein JSW50_03040 [Candidatus Latescibacterota bacterium]